MNHPNSRSGIDGGLPAAGCKGERILFEPHRAPQQALSDGAGQHRRRRELGGAPMPTRAATASSAPRVEAPNVKALMEAPMSKSPCRNPHVEIPVSRVRGGSDKPLG